MAEKTNTKEKTITQQSKANDDPSDSDGDYYSDEESAKKAKAVLKKLAEEAKQRDQQLVAKAGRKATANATAAVLRRERRQCTMNLGEPGFKYRCSNEVYKGARGRANPERLCKKHLNSKARKERQAQKRNELNELRDFQRRHTPCPTPSTSSYSPSTSAELQSLPQPVPTTQQASSNFNPNTLPVSDESVCLLLSHARLYPERAAEYRELATGMMHRIQADCESPPDCEMTDQPASSTTEDLLLLLPAVPMDATDWNLEARNRKLLCSVCGQFPMMVELVTFCPKCKAIVHRACFRHHESGGITCPDPDCNAIMQPPTKELLAERTADWKELNEKQARVRRTG